MEPYYDLWDVDTGNSLGTYETEAEALAVVRVLVDAYGLDYANDLDLGYSDEHGEVRSLATGSALLDRVRATAAEPLATTAGLQHS